MGINHHHQDTIAALASAPGKGAVGIIRISGPRVTAIAKQLLGHVPTPRKAHFSTFKSPQGQPLDQGLALYFKGPYSFTGEDVLELQGHGGSFIMDQLLRCVLACGARLAQPGEFSQRAFLNDKIDLTQAEAIADLINSTSQAAAHSALKSLNGAFKQHIDTLVEQLTQLRVFVEATIDFPDEDIDFLQQGAVIEKTKAIHSIINTTLNQAHTQALVQEGASLVILGEPNVGKSSLLNALSQKDSAIVTDQAGTTRDMIRETIHIDGLPLHIIDTAGLRDSLDQIEQEGIKRALKAATDADIIVYMLDYRHCTPEYLHQQLNQLTPKETQPLLFIANKTDLSSEQPTLTHYLTYPIVYTSIKQRQGLDDLKTHLKQQLGYRPSEASHFSARTRHVQALTQAQKAIHQALMQLKQDPMLELVAEDLRVAQQKLGEITGQVSSDELLGEIFSTFCIGK